MVKKIGLDKHAYTGQPQGYPRVSQPSGDIILDGWMKPRPHWSFDEELKTRAGKSARVPMNANDALNLMNAILSASQSVESK